MVWVYETGISLDSDTYPSIPLAWVYTTWAGAGLPA
jgi:hypothetical protein